MSINGEGSNIKRVKSVKYQILEQMEVEIISEYLPKQLSEEETKKLCTEIVQKIGAASIKDIGKIMGELKKNYADSLDFAKAGLILKEILK